jgi:stage II sporulation protein D
MKHGWWIAAAGIGALSIGCGGGMRPTPTTARSAQAYLRVQLPQGGADEQVRLEDYVRTTILSEFAPAGGEPAVVERMLEVQAVIARSYAVAHLSRHAREGFDLCSSTHCQLYQPARLATSRWATAAGTAAAHTRGEVLWFDAAPARALFHADCGGHTSAAADIWGGASSPYLRAAADDGPAASAHQPWRFEVDANGLRAALNADPRTAVGARLLDVLVTRRDDGGRAALVLLRGERDPLVRGEELRMVLTRAFGARSVRSTLFDVTRAGARFVFTGRGFGHGAGLCQAGAFARLQAGARPEQVLSRYYPGTRIVVLR